ncbi:MAG: Fic family protein [Candidatus Methanomethylophilaceae archaeon]|nr:Fic family protein [Candidatus Methanomethylophilaceae archaeon]
MKEDGYRPGKSGEIRVHYGQFSYFWPCDLPLEIHLDKGIERKMEKALVSLSRLDGKVSQLSEDERGTLLLPFVLMESVRSSAIEGTGTTMEDIYRSEREEVVDPVKRADNKEVSNYRDALRYAMSHSSKGLTEELLLETHKILMNGVRGENKSPGRYREVQVLVGNKGDTVDTARFVPIPPEEVPWKMLNLFEYMNGDEDGILMRTAMSHYQFETIHPFTDGNGRLGRLLVMLILNRGGVLRCPVLYLSGYFEGNRDAYIGCLNGIRERDDYSSWLNLFLDALVAQSESSSKLIDALHSYRAELHANESDVKLMRLKDSLFVNPYIRREDVAEICGVHITTAGRMVSKLVSEGVLEEISGRKRNQLFVCDRIMDILRSY